MYDATDPGQLIDAESLQRIIRGIQRVEAALINHDDQPPYITRKHQDKFRVIRGRSIGNQSGDVVVMNSVVPLSGGRDPSAKDTAVEVRVANIYFPKTLGTDQWFDAVFSPNVLPASDARSGGIQVDWECLESGSGIAGTGFRRFQLAQNKFSYESPALVYWLSQADALVGTGYVYDPESYFSGAMAGYTPGRSFRGVALLRGDMGTGTGGERWEIVDMEGYARWITGTAHTGTPATYTFAGVYPVSDNYLTREPYNPGDTISTTTTQLLNPIDGEPVLLMLESADGVTYGNPIYLPICARDRSVFLRIYGTPGTDGGVPKTGNVFPGLYCNDFAAANPSTEATTPCWVTDLRGHTYLPQNQYYTGRFDGFWTNGTDTRPRFVISAGLRAVTGYTGTAVKASDATFQIGFITPMYGPAPTGTTMTVEQVFAVGYASGQFLMAIETEDGHWINTPDTGKVRVSSSDMMPDYLYNSLTDTGVYTGTDQTLVKGQQVLVDGSTQNYSLRLFIDNPAGGGTGGGGAFYSAGCGLTLTGTQFSFDYDTVAGTDVLSSGLSKGTGPGCPYLKAIVNIAPGIISTAAPVMSYHLGAGGFSAYDPGEGQVKAMRRTTDPSMFLDFDGASTIENWSQVTPLAVGDQVLVATTREGDQFAIPITPNSDKWVIITASIPAATATGVTVTASTFSAALATINDATSQMTATGTNVTVRHWGEYSISTPATNHPLVGLIRPSGAYYDLVGLFRQPTQVVVDTTGNSLRVRIKTNEGNYLDGTINVADLLNALSGYAAAGNQSIGHDASGATQWQSDGSC